jgi:hypothetical protein
MRYEFVDIGTSFFCTSIDDYGLEVNGLLVEPIKEYLDCIPCSPTVIKANYAISDSNREDLVFSRENVNESVVYISKKELLENSSLRTNGIYGCNSLGKPHAMGGKNITTKCQVITFNELCKLYNVTEIGQLKLDTEGHEDRILPQVLDAIKSGHLNITERIIFEYNDSTIKSKLDQLITEFEQQEFTAKFSKDGIWDSDIILTKNN